MSRISESNRRFELGLDINPSIPRDDNMTWEEMARYTKPTYLPENYFEGEVIAAIEMDPLTGKITFVPADPSRVYGG